MYLNTKPIGSALNTFIKHSSCWTQTAMFESAGSFNISQNNIPDKTRLFSLIWNAITFFRQSAIHHFPVRVDLQLWKDYKEDLRQTACVPCRFTQFVPDFLRQRVCLKEWPLLAGDLKSTSEQTEPLHFNNDCTLTHLMKGFY